MQFFCGVGGGGGQTTYIIGYRLNSQFPYSWVTLTQNPCFRSIWTKIINQHILKLFLIYLAKCIMSGVLFWWDNLWASSLSWELCHGWFKSNWNWSKRNEVRINQEDTFCFIFDGVSGWQKFVLFKVKISSSSITHRGIQAHFSSEVVFWWDVDPYHVLTLVSFLDYLQSMPR